VKATSVGGYYGGIGGALLGARWAGYDVVYNYEPRAFFNLATWNANFPTSEYIEGGSPPPLDWVDFPEVDLVIGSPDCKQFSNLGTKRKDKKTLSSMDPNNFDYVDFLHFVALSKPKCFILENVPNILNYLKFKENVLNYVGWEKPVLILEDYTIQTIILNAKDFGVPQSRKRAFVIGSKSFKPDYDTDYNELSFLTDYYIGKTVSSAFEDISPTQDLPNHSAKRIEGFKNLRVGESYYDSQNNKRLDSNKVAGTVASHCSRFVHPTEPRVISKRETARLMGFPDNFKFIGRESEILDQIGKSIVPQVAFSITSYLKNQL